MKRAKYRCPLTVVMSEEMYRNIKQESEKQQTSKGEIVRNMLSAYWEYEQDGKMPEDDKQWPTVS